MAWMSNLGGEMTPVEDASPHYEQASGEVFALLEDSPWQTPISVVLRHLDNDVPKFRQMLVTMLARRDQWMRHLSSVDDGAGQMAGALRRLIEESLEQARGSVPKDSIEDLLAMAISGGRIESRETLPGTSIADLDNWLGIADALLTKDGNRGRSFRPDKDFPAWVTPISRGSKPRPSGYRSCWPKVRC